MEESMSDEQRAACAIHFNSLIFNTTTGSAVYDSLTKGNAAVNNNNNNNDNNNEVRTAKIKNRALGAVRKSDLYTHVETRQAKRPTTEKITSDSDHKPNSKTYISHYTDCTHACTHPRTHARAHTHTHTHTPHTHTHARARARARAHTESLLLFQLRAPVLDSTLQNVQIDTEPLINKHECCATLYYTFSPRKKKRVLQ